MVCRSPCSAVTGRPWHIRQTPAAAGVAIDRRALVQACFVPEHCDHVSARRHFPLRGWRGTRNQSHFSGFGLLLRSSGASRAVGGGGARTTSRAAGDENCHFVTLSVNMRLRSMMARVASVAAPWSFGVERMTIASCLPVRWSGSVRERWASLCSAPLIYAA